MVILRFRRRRVSARTRKRDVPATPPRQVWDDTESPAVPFALKPVEVRVCATPDGEGTAIFRRWPAGATGPQGSCRLCVRCYAYGDACLLTVPIAVTRAEAAAFSTRDFSFGPSVR